MGAQSKGAKRIEELRAEIEERKKSLPAHSIRPHQLLKIEELEEELEELEKKRPGGSQ